MGDNENSSSKRLKRALKKKSTQPKPLSLTEHAHVHSTPVKHPSCSQLPSPDKGLDVQAKPVEHRSYVHAPHNLSPSEKRKVKRSARTEQSLLYPGSPRGSAVMHSFSQSPRSSCGSFGSPRGSRPPMTIGANAKPVPHPGLSRIISMESSRSSYDMESEVHFMRRFSKGSGRGSDINLQKPMADSVANGAEDTPQSENRQQQRKSPHAN